MAGFRPVQSLTAGDYTSKVQTFYVKSTHASLLAVGDLVKETGTAANNPEGYSEVDAATAGANILGAIVGILPNFSNLEQAGLPASTAGYVQVLTDPYAIYEAVAATALATTDVGANADITATAATLSGGLVSSNMVIDGSAYGSATAQIRIVGLKDGATGANATCYCRINESSITSTTGV